MFRLKFFCHLFIFSHLFLSTVLLSKPYDESFFSDEYFVVLKAEPTHPSNFSSYQSNKSILQQVEEKVRRLDGVVLDTYLYAFVGLHVRLNSSFVNLLQEDSQVDFIEKNGMAFLFDEVANVRSWGIDRVDQRDLPLDQSYKAPYMGENTHSYIIDTGLRSTHKDFKGRVGDGFSALKDETSTEDCNGHGTHVAGTVAGLTSGVASKSMVHPVRVFGCGGSTGWDIIIKALNWVIANHKKPASINMSLGGAGNNALDTAVKNTIKAGINVVVAAGNSNKNACNYSPARVPDAITVASSTSKDARSSFSNWGSCVDLIAPGSAINSASHKGDNQYRSLSGTSMASPHVAGAVSLIQGIYPSWSITQVADLLTKKATNGKVGDVKGSPNKLLYVSDFGQVPQVDAGSDIIVRLPKDHIVLKGLAKDQDGYIIEASWQQISGHKVDVEGLRGFDWEQHLILSNLIVGDYVFRFWAKDNEGLTAYDDVKVKVTDKNLPPTANAGEDKRIILSKEFFLDGSKSYDPDGTLDSHVWKQLSGPSELVIKDPGSLKTKITDFVAGSYEFSLFVTDNEGLTSEDKVFVHVNHPPIVDAGEKQSIDWPKKSVKLEGKASDPDGKIIKIDWKQESGPNTAKISNKSSLITQVSGLVLGTYLFTLSVKDDMKVTSSDQVQIDVVSSNQLPVVSGGGDIELVLPDNKTVLKGTCYDPDGSCVKTIWKYQANSNLKNILPLQKNLGSDLYLSGLEEGTYLFQFVGIDNEEGTSSDDVKVVVKKATK